MPTKKKELWPGAGLYLDLINLKSEDLDKIERRLDELESTQEKIWFLQRFVAEYEHAFGGHNHVVSANELKMRLEVKNRFSSLMGKLNRVREIEARRARAERTKQVDRREQQASTTARDFKEFTTARQVLALHFLMKALGVRYDQVNKTDAARLVQFLTGKNWKNVYDEFREVSSSLAGRQDDLKFILPFFENLGLVEIVEEIKDQL